MHACLRKSAANSQIKSGGCLQDVSESKQDGSRNLQSVDQQIQILESQLNDAEELLRLSDAATVEACSRAEQLKNELGEARSVIAMLESSAATYMQHTSDQRSVAQSAVSLSTMHSDFKEVWQRRPSQLLHLNT
jgi:chromosome segregation ATPase